MDNQKNNSSNNGEIGTSFLQSDGLKEVMLSEVVSDTGGIDYDCPEFRYAFIPSSTLQKVGSDILIFPTEKQSSCFVEKRNELIKEGNDFGELSGSEFDIWLKKLDIFAKLYGFNCLTMNQRILLAPAGPTNIKYKTPKATLLQNAIANGCNRAVEQKVLNLQGNGNRTKKEAEELVLEHLDNDWQMMIATLPTERFPEGVMEYMENKVSASLENVE